MKNNGNKKFDVVLMNPPYQHGLCNNFFSKVLDFANIVVTIQPTGWLIAKKQNKNIASKLDNVYSEFTILNPHIFDAWFLNNVSINYIDYTKSKEINLYDEIYDIKHTYNNVNEITKVSLDKYLSEFNSIIKPCYGGELMQDNVCETHGRVIRLLDALNIDYDEDVAFDIMLENLVCSDFFELDFENWCRKTK